jgi:hypothetical protein
MSPNEVYETSALHALNHTELYQLTRRAGLRVHPRASREELIWYLLGLHESAHYDEIAHPIDSLRVAIINFLTEFWSTLAPQLTCPAKMLKHPTTPNPRPCFGCSDAQVVTCVVDSKDPKVEQLIILRRPKRGA